MIDVVQHAEAAGIESVWTFEHVVVPSDYESKYPYDRSGKMPAAPETCFFDPLISLAHVAAATKTIRLGTGVNIFPQTNPMLFAKQAASLDALSARVPHHPGPEARIAEALDERFDGAVCPKGVGRILR